MPFRFLRLLGVLLPLLIVFPLPSGMAAERKRVQIESSLGRVIYLRRRAGRARITIFEGGHEAIDAATVAWFERHVKPR